MDGMNAKERFAVALSEDWQAIEKAPKDGTVIVVRGVDIKGKTLVNKTRFYGSKNNGFNEWGLLYAPLEFVNVPKV